MESIKYSITVPVYNVEKYLPQCIESVLNQNYDNFELILVNDGSTDGSGSICDEYARKDSRIKVIHKENEGLLLTRRAALKYVTGDYVMFLDSDDYWTDNILNRITDVINKYDCDLVMFDYKSVFVNGEKDNDFIFSQPTVFEGEGKRKLYESLFQGRVNNMCTKVVKKEIVDIETNYMAFAHIKFGEDLLQSSAIIFNSQKAVYIPECLYCYRRGTGITSVTVPKIIKDNTDVHYAITNLFLQIQDYDLSKIINGGYCYFLNSISKNIVLSYIADKNETKKDIMYTIKHPFYRTARTYRKETNYISRLIWFAAEHQLYIIIAAMALAVKAKNKLRTF